MCSLADADITEPEWGGTGDVDVMEWDGACIPADGWTKLVCCAAPEQIEKRTNYQALIIAKNILCYTNVLV